MFVNVDVKQDFQKCSVYREQPIHLYKSMNTIHAYTNACIYCDISRVVMLEGSSLRIRFLISAVGLRDKHRLLHYSPVAITSNIYEALLKFYFQDIPPPNENKAIGVGQRWVHAQKTNKRSTSSLVYDSYSLTEEYKRHACGGARGPQVAGVLDPHTLAGTAYHPERESEGHEGPAACKHSATTTADKRKERESHPPTLCLRKQRGHRVDRRDDAAVPLTLAYPLAHWLHEALGMDLVSDWLLRATGAVSDTANMSLACGVCGWSSRYEQLFRLCINKYSVLGSFPGQGTADRPDIPCPGIEPSTNKKKIKCPVREWSPAPEVLCPGIKPSTDPKISKIVKCPDWESNPAPEVPCKEIEPRSGSALYRKCIRKYNQKCMCKGSNKTVVVLDGPIKIRLLRYCTSVIRRHTLRRVTPLSSNDESGSEQKCYKTQLVVKSFREIRVCLIMNGTSSPPSLQTLLGTFQTLCPLKYIQAGSLTFFEGSIYRENSIIDRVRPIRFGNRDQTFGNSLSGLSCLADLRTAKGNGKPCQIHVANSSWARHGLHETWRLGFLQPSGCQLSIAITLLTTWKTSTSLLQLSVSPPVPAQTMANRVRFPASSLPDFRTWESCRTMPLVSGFSRGSSVSSIPSYWHCSILTSITLTDSQDLEVKSRPNLFTHSLTQCMRVKLRIYHRVGGVGKGGIRSDKNSLQDIPPCRKAQAPLYRALRTFVRMFTSVPHTVKEIYTRSPGNVEMFRIAPILDLGIAFLSAPQPIRTTIPALEKVRARRCSLETGNQTESCVPGRLNVEYTCSSRAIAMLRRQLRAPVVHLQPYERDHIAGLREAGWTHRRDVPFGNIYLRQDWEHVGLCTWVFGQTSSSATTLS
ncbi:hypothetical protein PR048_000879 [Dryococelus australis]|uniref:Uncharacterized protein n=1 Tax=Dryococelus australis TaxID=614101 RepID=A0ABQ9IFU0_9NEOP|nr:hypothetical protein PR048_000879 [Dryococelus australis]